MFYDKNEGGRAGGMLKKLRDLKVEVGLVVQ
jgi:hypothetical protein